MCVAELQFLLYLYQCEECERPFLSLQHDGFEVISKCVFCRLSSPARSILPLPPSIPPDL